MFPEHVERSFLDPEYSFVAVRRKLPTRFTKQKLAQLRTTGFSEYPQLGSRRNIHPVKIGLNVQIIKTCVLGPSAPSFSQCPSRSRSFSFSCCLDTNALDSGESPHSEHRFPAPSSKLCRSGYATEGALFISAQLPSDAISALRKVRVLI